MSLGSILLMIIAFLIFFGIGHRVLDRMYLTDKQALVFIVLLIIGSFFDVTLSGPPREVLINVGGGLIPIILAIYVLRKAGTKREWMRAILATVVTTGVIYGIVKTVNFEPDLKNVMILDPTYVFAIVAGIVGYLSGRSRRSAFVAAILSLVLMQIITLIELYVRNLNGRIHIGGAGAIDTIVIAAVIAVMLAEFIGEIREKIQGESKQERDQPDELKGVEYANALLNDQQGSDNKKEILERRVKKGASKEDYEKNEE